MIVSFLDGQNDPLQFVYQPDKGLEDVKLFIPDTVQAPGKDLMRNFYWLTFPAASHYD